MSCAWSDQVQRYADGALDADTRRAFAAHLTDCPACQRALDEAQRLERVLRAGITPVQAPPTLAARVVAAGAATLSLPPKERAPGVLQRIAGRFRPWRLSPALAGLALALLLCASAYAAAPERVTALVQRVLFFVPGLGIQTVGADTLVADEPVVVAADGLTLTIESLLSDGANTRVKFELAGLPGGKEGWSEGSRGRPRQPVLRDAAGREYALTSAQQSVGGSEQANVAQGEMTFAPLPSHLRRIEMVLPLDFVVPPGALPGSDQQQLVASIPLAPAQQSSLPAATPQSASATDRGITLRVVASTLERDRTVLLVDGSAADGERLSSLYYAGRHPLDAMALRDDRGRTYEPVMPGSHVTWGRWEFPRDLYFEPVAADARELTLEIRAVQVTREGSANLTVPLSGRRAGEQFPVNQVVNLAGHEIAVELARLAEEQDGPWLYLDVDLGGTRDGRGVISFSAHRSGGSSSMASFASRHGGPGDYIGVPVEIDAQGNLPDDVTIRFSDLEFEVTGDWTMTFPVQR